MGSNVMKAVRWDELRREGDKGSEEKWEIWDEERWAENRREEKQGEEKMGKERRAYRGQNVREEWSAAAVCMIAEAKVKSLMDR